MKTTMILVADRDSQVLDAAAAALEDRGYAAIRASTGSRALSVLEDNPGVAVAVIDLGLTAGRGGRRRLIDEIRSRPRWTSLPVILMSTVISVNEIAEILELGPSYFVPKPLRPEDLAEYVERSLRRSAAA